MALIFEWDARKAAANRRKHRVSFEEAATVFGDPRSITIPDPLHSSTDEERFVDIGQSSMARVLVVVYAEWQGRIRIISARKANAYEKNDYESA